MQEDNAALAHQEVNVYDEGVAVILYCEGSFATGDTMRRLQQTTRDSTGEQTTLPSHPSTAGGNLHLKWRTSYSSLREVNTVLVRFLVYALVVFTSL